MQDVCNWRQWSMNNEETDSLLESKKDKPMELRSFSFSRIQNPTTISSTNLLLTPSEELSSGNISSIINHDKVPDQNSLFRARNDTCSLVIPSSSFIIPNNELKITTSCTGNYEASTAGRRYSDIIFVSRDKNQINSFSNNYLESNMRNIHKRVSHHLSHNIISQSRNMGIDEIGLDYMRANGAIPGFKQLHQPLSKCNEQKSSVASLINIFTKNPFNSSHSFDKSGSCNYLQGNVESNDNSKDHSNKDKLQQNCLSNPTQKSSYTRGSRQIASRSIKSVGYRLGRRKELYEKRMRISDFSLSFAVFGILVMVIDAELLWAGIYKKNSIYSILLKSLITISTVILLGLILAYHALVIQLFSCDDCIEDWRIAISWQSVAQLLLELLVCSIHPVPGNISISKYFMSSPMKAVNDNDENLENMIEPILAVPMLFRFYMIFRSLLLHSKMFRDAGSRSIGAMNKVSFDTRFILKTLMTMCPGTVLLTFILTLWILLSWTIRMCEINTNSPKHANMLNCMWLIAVTFLSIGYGDIVPHTHCGRGIAISAGVMGSACTALLVAVFARKLELSKAEKHVTQFVLENQMTKKLKYYAANVLRETWLIYKYTKLVKHVNGSKVRTHQRKFLKAIHGLRKLKIDQRKFQDNSNTLVDLAKTQSNIYEAVTEMRLHHSYLEKRISKIEDNLVILHDQLKSLPEILSNIITSKTNCTGSPRS